MQRLLTWVRNNKLATLLLLVVAYFLWKNFFGASLLGYRASSTMMGKSAGIGGMANPVAPSAFGSVARDLAMPDIYPIEQEAPPTTTPNRMVIRDTSLSLQVKNVSEAIDRIEGVAVAAGGYMVDSNLTVPEGAASGSISIRVPSEKRKDVLTSLRGLAVKVVSESVLGRDVTDQYTDLEARLAVLTKTKAKFEEIQGKAETVEELLQVQRELINLQSQIDSLKGQQEYLSQTAKLTKITLYLGTDEFALPYTPDQPWRPEVIFKQAVRSLVGSVRSIGTLVIWLGVYAVIWIPLGLLVWWLMKRTK